MVKELILDFLNTEMPDEDISFLSPRSELLSNGFLDSMGMMRLVLFLEKKLDIQVPNTDLTLENFNSIADISTYIMAREKSTLRSI